MKYADIIRLYEDKHRFIDGNPNLTDEQKTEIKNFFDTHNNLDKLISNWEEAKREYTYEDFYNIMKPYIERDKERAENKRKKAERDKKINDYFEYSMNNRSYLSDEELKALKALTRKAPKAIDDIDWENARNYRYKDFTDKFTPYQKDYIMKKGKLSDLKEGEDYISLGSDDTYNYYYVLTHKASRIFGSNAVAPKMWWNFTKKDAYGRERTVGNHGWYRKHNLIFDYPYEEDMSKKANEEGVRPLGYGGASWCIAMPHSDMYWIRYLLGTFGGDRFVYAIANRPKVAEKKVAVRFDSSNGSIIEVVSGATDAEISDSNNLMLYPREKQTEHIACKNKIKNFLNNNDKFRKLFVTHEIPDPIKIVTDPTTNKRKVYVNNKLVWEEKENQDEYAD